MNARPVLSVLVVFTAAAGAWWYLSRRAQAAAPVAGEGEPSDLPAWMYPDTTGLLGSVYSQLEDTVSTITNGPRGIRNNNPGNLRPGSNWQGLASPPTDGANYLRFVSAHYGLRAAAINLRNQQLKHGLNTVRKIISKYAPPSENDTASYIAAVCNALGVAPDTPLNLSNAATLEKFLRAVVRHENGKGDWYDSATYAGAVQAALA